LLLAGFFAWFEERGSSVGKATRLRAKRPNSEDLVAGRGQRIIFFFRAHLASCTMGMDTESLFPGPEADHSSPSSAKFKNDGAIPPLSHDIMAWCLIH
jgi:hypothetical protein